MDAQSQGGTKFECTKLRGEAKFERTKLTGGQYLSVKKVKIMYVLYAYIHYIIMLLAYFIFWSRGT